MPQISIIIPVYNVGKYLNKCLDSIINQTFSDIDVICVDDGSTDSSFQILKEYEKNDSRIKVFSQKNSGSGAARNLGLDKADGKYIMFVDPDDWLSDDACELAYNKINTNNNDFVLFTHYKYFEDNNRLLEQTEKLKPFQYIQDCPNINLAEVADATIVNCNIWDQIYKKSFLDSNNIRFPDLRCTQDLPFVIDCWLKSSNISILNKSIYYYRVRENSMTFSEECYLDRFKAREMAFKRITDSHNKNVENAYCIHYVNSLEGWYFQIPENNIVLKSKYYKKMKKIYLMLKENHNNDFFRQHIDLKFFNFVCNNDFAIMALKEFLQTVFSVKNTGYGWYKVIRILGIKIKIRRKK